MADSGSDCRPSESEHSWTWLVKKCSEYLKNSPGNYESSPPFTIGKFKLEFRMYLGGVDWNSQEYVGVLLKLLEPSSSQIKFSIHIGYETIKMFKMTKCDTKFEVNSQSLSCPGNKKLVERKILIDQVLQFSNDELMVKCILYNLDLPESHRRLQLLDGYEKFVNNEKLSDVQIVVGKRIINAHKLVLINENQVFAAMFEHNMSENEEGVVYIDDIDYDVMVEIVRYIYTGKVERVFYKTKDLLKAADKYNLADLKTLCGKYLCMDLSPDNFFEYVKFAQQYGVDELTQAAEAFFISRGGEISDVQNFKELLGTLDTDIMANLWRKNFKKPRLA